MVLGSVFVHSYMMMIYCSIFCPLFFLSTSIYSKMYETIKVFLTTSHMKGIWSIKNGFFINKEKKRRSKLLSVCRLNENAENYKNLNELEEVLDVLLCYHYAILCFTCNKMLVRPCWDAKSFWWKCHIGCSVRCRKGFLDTNKKTNYIACLETARRIY
jgi:hypothetical protein